MIDYIIFGAFALGDIVLLICIAKDIRHIVNQKENGNLR